MNYRFDLLGAFLVLLFVVLAAHLVPPLATAQVNMISELSIEANRSDYSGPCPKEIKLKGKLKAEAVLGVVRYQFVHSDGTQGAISQLAINSKGVFTVEETLQKNASWNDTVYLRVFLPILPLAPIPLDSNRITIKGECQEARVVPRQESISLGPASGRFRVTLNGFTCNHQTRDDPLQTDGPDDEIFLFTKSFFVQRRADDASRFNFSSPLRRRTGRIQRGNGGGFRSGDSFPSAPDRHSTNPQPYDLPQLIWEGELTRRQNAVVIIPMIWEWDGIPGLFQAWETAGLDQFYGVGDLISDPNLTDQDSAKVALRGEVVGQVWLNGREGLVPEDRPIGMRGYDRDYRFRPEVLILTYDEALRMALESQRKNGDAFPVVYADAPELGGNYTLYIQVEQLP
jgi:hypothetical protein